MPEKPNPSRISLTLDLSAKGRHVGDAMVRWSDNSNPLGYHAIPLISVKGGEGPVLLIIGGTHGDEFEGPSAIMRLANSVNPDDIHGQLILLPAFNAPAVMVSSRNSPLDGENLNRAFPGDANGGPTAMLAHFLETVLMPMCDAAIDLHSGGKASFFKPCALPTDTADEELAEKNMELAKVFGLPLIWRLGRHNDNRSVNSAAERARIPMIACELGGGGGVDPEITEQAERGLRRVMQHLQMTKGENDPVPTPRVVEIASVSDSIYAHSEGIFDRATCAGQNVRAGDFAGWFHYIAEPERPSDEIKFSHGGLVLAHTNRGFVKRGDMLALVCRDVAK